MTKATRRQFIKIAGLGAGAVAGSGLVSNLWGLDPNLVHDPKTEGDKIVPTFCEICFWKCGVNAHVKDGRVTKLEGNPHHPLSRGRLCPRGTGGMGLLYDPDRLKKPLIRRDKRGSQVFEEVDWTTALDHIAEKLSKYQATPEALALYSHGYGGTWFKHLVKAFGSPNIGAPSDAQCRGARETAFSLTYGAPLGSPEHLDMPNSRVITFIGSHLGENMHNTQVQDLATAISRGAQLIVVDPRFSVVAGKARHWLPIKPGTDIALLLAWMHVIIKERLYDREYVEKHTVGFEELSRHVADKTPEWAFTRTTIAPEVIVETARLIGGARPASLIHPGRRTAWYGDDVQRLRAIAILNALVGAYGRKGGFYIPAKPDLPKVPSPPYSRKKAQPADWQKGQNYPFADSILAHGLRDASFPGTADYDIKAWLVYGCNLLMALPDPKRTIEAIQKLEFMVAVDVLPAEITGWADVVLPEATYLERYDDIASPPYREPYLALRQPVVEPLHDSKPGWWIARELANRMGLQEYFPWENVTDYLEARLSKGGYDFKELKEKGVILTKPEPLYLEDGIAPAFCPDTGKIELYSQKMADAQMPGVEPLPHYTDPDEPNRADEEFRLLFGRSPVHTFGRTTNNRFLSEIMDKNVLWVNRRIAGEMSMTCGDWVVLVNDNWKCGKCGQIHSGKSRPAANCPGCGADPSELVQLEPVRSAPIQVKRTRRIRPDCLYMVHGFGHNAKGLKFARGRGASDATLMNRVKIDPVMGGTGMNDNFVRIEKTTAPEEARS